MPYRRSIASARRLNRCDAFERVRKKPQHFHAGGVFARLRGGGSDLPRRFVSYRQQSLKRGQFAKITRRAAAQLSHVSLTHRRISGPYRRLRGLDLTIVARFILRALSGETVLVFGSSLRQIGAAIAMAALMAFVLHEGFASHAHPPKGMSIGAQAQDHVHGKDHAHKHEAAHKSAVAQPDGDGVDRSCDGECCGLACAIALPGASVATIAILTGWTGLRWSREPLQHGIATGGLRRPPRATNIG